MNHIPSFVVEDLKRLGLEAALTTLAQQGQFLDLLLDTNRHFNLTGIRDRDAAWRGHVIDSLTALPFLELLAPGAAVIDVGSGGGLPGIPIAMARPDLCITLLEATGKKAKFLELCVKELNLTSCAVLHDRAETVGQNPAHRQRYDTAVCRAIGPVRELLEYLLPLVRVGGRCLAFKAQHAEQELKEAGRAMDLLGAGAVEVADTYGSAFDRHSVMIVVHKQRSTPMKYPRSPGAPRCAPL